MKKKCIIVQTFIFIIVFILGSCKKNSEEVCFKKDTTTIDESSCPFLNEETLMQYTNSEFAYRFLMAAKVSRILCQGEGRYDISLLFGTRYEVSIDDYKRTMIITSNENNHQVFFHEDCIVVRDLRSNRSSVHSIVEGIGNELDPVIIVAVAAKVYHQEVGSIPYHINHEELLFQTESYLCMHPRKIWCNKERMEKKLEEYCEGAPAFVGGTDCGCIWGDFFCICITEFEC